MNRGTSSSTDHRPRDSSKPNDDKHTDDDDADATVGYVPAFYVPATAAQVELERGQQLLLERRVASQMFGPSPVLMVESKRARRQWFWLLGLRFLIFTFIVVVLCSIVNLYYRIPTLGYACEFYQNYNDPSISSNSQLATGVGLLACQFVIGISAVSLSILFGQICFLCLLLSKTFTFYRYAVVYVFAQVLLVLGLFGSWLFTAIYLLLALITTCSNLVCARGLWSHQRLANWLVIFSWLISILWLIDLIVVTVSYIALVKARKRVQHFSGLRNA